MKIFICHGKHETVQAIKRPVKLSSGRKVLSYTACQSLFSSKLSILVNKIDESFSRTSKQITVASFIWP